MNDSSLKALAHTNCPTWIGRSDCSHCSIFNEVLFPSSTAGEMESIIAGIHEPTEEFSYKPGTILYEEGGEDNAIYTIRGGLVKLVRYRSDGSERIIRLLKTADPTGLERLLDKPYGHTAIAIREVNACRIPVGKIQRLKTEMPRFYRQLMERWAIGLFQADDCIILLMTGPARDRVVHLIEWLSTATNGNKTNDLNLLRGKDMAAMLDLSIESVSRIMAELKRRGILWHTDRRDYYGFDADRLRKYASEYRCRDCA